MHYVAHFCQCMSIALSTIAFAAWHAQAAILHHAEYPDKTAVTTDGLMARL